MAESDLKIRIVSPDDIAKCSRQSFIARHWFPVHDCGDPECPMVGK